MINIKLFADASIDHQIEDAFKSDRKTRKTHQKK